MPKGASATGPPQAAVQVSFLIDTDILSLLERKHVPPKLADWVQSNEAEIFLSVISFAELQFGLDRAPASHRPSLAAWLTETRQKFAPATEALTEPVLVRWKELLADLKKKNRTMTCEDSLIAATALFHDHTLATHNRRHFKPSGVRIIDPLD
jgi:predicted nucleic acid-binding protein